MHRPVCFIAESDNAPVLLTKQHMIMSNKQGNVQVSLNYCMLYKIAIKICTVKAETLNCISAPFRLN